MDRSPKVVAPIDLFVGLLLCVGLDELQPLPIVLRVGFDGLGAGQKKDRRYHKDIIGWLFRILGIVLALK